MVTLGSFTGRSSAATRITRKLGSGLTVGALAATLVITGLGSPAAHADDPAPLAGGVQIDVGGSVNDGTFVPDQYGTGGIPDTKPADAASLPNWGPTVAHPIPDAVWNTSRFLESSYTVPGLTPGGAYQLRLYFMDWYFSHPGQRIFDVDVNGSPFLINFDIIGTAVARGADGQEAFGVERDLSLTADATGTVRIDFIRGAANQPQINAISLVPDDSAPAALTPPAGLHSIGTYHVVSGTQTYTCANGSFAGASVPEATLSGPAGQVHHFAGPSWQSVSDQSLITATRTAGVNVAGSIPELLLTVNSHSGPTDGLLAQVQNVQRLNTSGGAAPTTACTDGDTTAVPYTADYVFWAN